MPPSAKKTATGPVRATYALWMGTDLFSRDALAALLNDPLRVTSSGRSARGGDGQYSLVQLVNAAARALEGKKPLGRAVSFVDVAGSMPRDAGRWDVKLTQEWVNRMRGVNVAFARMCQMVEHIKSADPRCGRAKAVWHMQKVSPGSPDQEPHSDDVGGRARCYYTLIVPLTDNPLAGGTHFPDHGHTFADYGGALVFNGIIKHAGLGNRTTDQDRYFLYAAIYTGTDKNSD